ncbi:MAG TPA: hypothetical protein PLI77_09675 [Bacteroidales bacterium]|nr:hypothetical protein [Bacteroidales bacterium]
MKKFLFLLFCILFVSSIIGAQEDRLFPKAGGMLGVGYKWLDMGDFELNEIWGGECGVSSTIDQIMFFINLGYYSGEDKVEESTVRISWGKVETGIVYYLFDIISFGPNYSWRFPEFEIKNGPLVFEGELETISGIGFQAGIKIGEFVLEYGMTWINEPHTVIGFQSGYIEGVTLKHIF